MAADRQEIADFKARLGRTPTKVIMKLLDDDVITRAWKRELAEAEVARRNEGESRFSANEALRLIHHHKSAVLKSWLIAAFLIVCLIAVAIMFGLNITSK